MILTRNKRKEKTMENWKKQFDENRGNRRVFDLKDYSGVWSLSDQDANSIKAFMEELLEAQKQELEKLVFINKELAEERDMWKNKYLDKYYKSTTKENIKKVLWKSSI